MQTTPDPILVGSNVTYHLSVSNATGFNLNPGVITSEYSDKAEFVQATNRFGITNSPGRVDFEIQSFAINEVFQILMELRGTNAGLLTNKLTVSIDDQGQTTPASTNVVSSIELPPEADLGITVLGPPNGVFPLDTFTYQLVATNTGPNNASQVTVSNPLPANVSFVGFNPESQMEFSTNGVVLFSINALTSGTSALATVTVLATNAASTNLILAGISAPNITDTNSVNDSFATNVPILVPITNQILASIASPQRFNPQTGWMEQRVLLENIATTNLASVRLRVEGLTNQVVNASGTNGSTPYVAHGGVLNAGEKLELLLEYNNPLRGPGPDPTLVAYGTPPLDLTPEVGTSHTVQRIVQITATNLNQGRMLLEWAGTNGSTYQVIYDEHVDFPIAKGSMPKIIAHPSANRVQWLDYGPPRTLAAPGTTTSRFYKVIELP